MTGVNYENLPIEYSIPFDWGTFYVTEAAYDAYPLPQPQELPKINRRSRWFTGDPQVDCYVVAPGEFPDEIVEESQKSLLTTGNILPVTDVQKGSGSKVLSVATGLNLSPELVKGSEKYRILDAVQKYEDRVPKDELDKFAGSYIAGRNIEADVISRMRLMSGVGAAVLQAAQPWYRSRISRGSHRYGYGDVASERNARALSGRIISEVEALYGLSKLSAKAGPDTGRADEV